MCIHKQDLHLAQQGISNQSRARQVQFKRNKSITHDLELTSREWKAVLIILIQVSQNSQRQVVHIHFSTKFLSSNFECQGLKACHALLSNEAKPMPKTIRSLRHSFQSCTALPGFSQVQSEPSRKLDQCDKQSHLYSEICIIVGVWTGPRRRQRQHHVLHPPFPVSGSRCRPR